ncbi:MAG: alpha/beta hydrolase [Actinobacteria bacterium]|nr:alpha/beta hydrolase [Actinomycetota bacterium]
MSVEQLQQILSVAPAGPDFANEPHVARKAFDGMLASLPVPEDSTVAESSLGGVPVVRATVPESKAGRILLYVHGGAYVSGTAQGYLGLAVNLARAAAAELVSVNYRLAPESQFPSAVDDAVAVYRALLSEVQAEAITVAGDSAGGGLAVAMLLAARDAGLEQPSCAVLLSPWADLSCAAPSMTERAERDPLLSQEGLANSAAAYLGTQDSGHPLASPVNGHFEGIAPLHIHVGSEEILHDDAVRLAERVRETGGSAEIKVWEGMIHDWSLFWFAGLEEATALIAEAGDSMTRSLAAPTD